MVSQMGTKLIFLRRPMCMTQIQTQQMDTKVVQRKLIIHVKGLAFKPMLLEFLKNFHLWFFEILERSKNLLF